MARMFSESMLAIVIAFEKASVPREELQYSVGRDGGMVVGRGIVYQTPVAEYLSEEDGEFLFNSNSELIGEYDKGRLKREQIDIIKMRNRSSKKAYEIRRTLRRSRD